MYIMVKVIGKYAASVLYCNVGDLKVATIHRADSDGILIKLNHKYFFLDDRHFEWNKAEALRIACQKEEVSCL